MQVYQVNNKFIAIITLKYSEHNLTQYLNTYWVKTI